MKSTIAVSCRALAVGALVVLAPAAWAAAPTVIHVEDGAKNAPFDLSFDQTTVPAGRVELEVRNDSPGVDHEVVIARTDDKAGDLPYDAKTQRVDESKLDVVGEVEDMKPGHKERKDFDLDPGHYVAFCNEPGHYRAGMYTPFTVTRAPDRVTR